jgi:hypothetical protein
MQAQQPRQHPQEQQQRQARRYPGTEVRLSKTRIALAICGITGFARWLSRSRPTKLL